MRQYNQWINYKITNQGEKLPISPHNHAVCNPHDSGNWVSYEQALATNLPVAFVFSKSDPFFFVDIDDCINPNRSASSIAITLWNLLMGCEIEVSQSGNGLHIFGTIPVEVEHACRRSDLNIKMYTEKRFCAITGIDRKGDANFTPSTSAYMALTSRFFPVQHPHGESVSTEWTSVPVPEWKGPEDNTELIKKMLKSRSVKNIVTAVICH